MAFDPDAYIAEMEGKPFKKAPSALPTKGKDYDELFQRASETHGVPVEILKAVTKQESAFNPKAKSGAGAMGLMQLMPGTAKDLGVSDPFDPEQNVMAGSKYLAQMYKQTGDWPKAFAAYNAGLGNVRKYGGIPPFKETQGYVSKIMKSLGDGLIPEAQGYVNPFSHMEMTAKNGTQKNEPFDPDAYIAEMQAAKNGSQKNIKSKIGNDTSFDPDAYLAGLESKSGGKEKIGPGASTLQQFLSFASGVPKAMPFFEAGQKVGKSIVGLLPESMQQAGREADIVSQAREAAPGFEQGGEIVGNLISALPQWKGAIGLTKAVIPALAGEGGILANLGRRLASGAITGPAMTTLESLKKGELPSAPQLGISAGLGGLGEVMGSGGRKFAETKAQRLMGSALKISKKEAEEQMKSTGKTLAQEVLEKTSLPRTTKGYEALSKKNLDVIEDGLQNVLKEVKGPITRTEVIQDINKLRDSFKPGLIGSEQAQKSIDSFIKEAGKLPAKMTASEANVLKRDLYNTLSKVYGKEEALLPLTKQAMKAEARSFRSQIEKRAAEENLPNVADMNQQLRFWGKLQNKARDIQNLNLGKDIFNLKTLGLSGAFGLGGGLEGYRRGEGFSSGALAALLPLIGSTTAGKATLAQLLKGSAPAFEAFRLLSPSYTSFSNR